MLKAAKFLEHFDNVMLKFLTDNEKAALKKRIQARNATYCSEASSFQKVGKGRNMLQKLVPLLNNHKRSHDCCNTEQLPLLHQWSQRLQHKKSLSNFTTHDPEMSEVQMFRARKRYDLP